MQRAFYFKGGLKDSPGCSWPGGGSLSPPGSWTIFNRSLVVARLPLLGLRQGWSSAVGTARCHRCCLLFLQALPAATLAVVPTGTSSHGAGRWRAGDGNDTGSTRGPSQLQPAAAPGRAPFWLPRAWGTAFSRETCLVPILSSSFAGTRALSRTAPAGSSMPPAFRRSISSSSPLVTQPNSPPLFSMSSTRTK